MPFSQSSQLSTIVGFIEQSNPASILDVGVGMGQYGFLARINLENEHLFVVDGDRGWQRPKSEWRVKIDGIEGCATYLTPIHEYVYNTLTIGDALALLPKVPDAAYDLVLAIDILEHFDMPDGIRFLAELKRVCSRAALVSTPKEFIHQDIPANPYENHRSVWSQQDLASQGFDRLLPNDASWIAAFRKA